MDTLSNIEYLATETEKYVPFVAVSKFMNTPLDIVIVSYNASKKEVIELIEKINSVKYLPTKNKWLNPKDNFGKLKRGTE